jgi:hypothetical protein
METQNIEPRTQFDIPSANHQAFLDKIAKLNKTAQKLGCSNIVATQLTSFVREVSVVVTDGEGGEMIDTYKTTFYKYEVTGAAPKLEGWTFMCTIEPTEAGNILRCVPGQEVDASYQTAALVCQHCNKNRRRSEYFLVKKDQDTKMVGRNCIRDFLGHTSPDRIAGFMEGLGELHGFCGDGAGCSREHRTYPVKEVAEWTLAAIAKDGWVPRSYNPESCTANTVSELLNPPRQRDEFREWQKMREEYSKRIKAEKVEACLAEILKLENVSNRSNFDNNLLVIAKLEAAGYKELGILVAGIANIARKIEAEIAARNERANKSNEWMGTIGERKEFALVCVKIRDIATDYGKSTLLVFEDESGNVFKWFASGEKDFEVGDKYILKGTVKKHDEYQGRRQTALTRCSIVKHEKVA